MIRLTPSKRKCLSALLNYKDPDTDQTTFVNAFEKLEPFCGLWKGFQLGTMKHDFALHCPEELLHCLDHTYKRLNEITLGNPHVQRAFDIPTCEGLRDRAPSASLLDRQHIIREMDSRAFFSTLLDENLRERVTQALLQLPVIIPTLRSYHKNLTYFSIGARIIQSLLLSEPVKTTMYRTLRGKWSPTDHPLVEVREGEYRRVVLPSWLPPYRFVYIQLHVAARRLFPRVSTDAPNKEKDRKRKRAQGPAVISGPVAAAKLVFWRHAHKLGFRTEKIINGLRAAEDVPVEVPEPFVEDTDGETIDRRSGKPYMNAYKQLRTQLFLPNLRQIQVGSSLNPSVMFVQWDHINAFFGRIDGWDFAPSPAPTALLDPVGNSSRPDAVAPLESGVVLEQGDEWSRSRLGSVISTQSVSSRYSQTASQLSMANSEPAGTVDWSRFSLPALDDSGAADEVELQNQAEGAVASISDIRRSFPTSVLADVEPQTFEIANLQDADIPSPSTATPGWSFPDLEEPQSSPTALGTSKSRSSELEFQPFGQVNDVGRRSFPATEVSSSSNVGVLMNGRRSFPDLEEPKSSPTALGTSRRQSSELEFLAFGQVSDVGRRSFPAIEVSSTSSNGPAVLLHGRRSFPAPEILEPDLSGRNGNVEAQWPSSSTHLPHPPPELGDERRSFPELGDEAASRTVSREDSPPFTFVEYDGRVHRVISTNDIESYLQGRKGWTMIVLKNQVLKTIRFSRVLEHMLRGSGEYFLMAPHIARDFRREYVNHLRQATYRDR